MTWEQLDDLKHAAVSRNLRVPAGLIISLIIAGSVGIAATRWWDASPTLILALLFLGSLLTALGIYVGQRSVVAFVATTYPTERPQRVSMGEVVATLLTVVILATSGGLGYLLSVANNGPADDGPALTYLPAATPVVGARVYNGWKEYRDPASGFFIQLPPDWASAAYDTVARGEEPTREMKFYAEANDKSANLVLERWVGGRFTLGDYLAEFAAALERDGASEISRTRVTLPVGQAGLVRFSQTYSGAHGSVTDHVIDYIVVKNRAFRTTIYRIQFRADSFTPAMEDTVRSIVTTFHVT